MSKKTIVKGIEVRYKERPASVGLPFNVFLKVYIDEAFREIKICISAQNFVLVTLLEAGIELGEVAVSAETSMETFYVTRVRSLTRDVNFCGIVQQIGYPRTAFQLKASNYNGDIYSEVLTIDWATIFPDVNPPIVTPPIVTPPIVEPPIVTPPIVEPPIVNEEDVGVIFIEPEPDLATPDGISVAEEITAIALSLSVSRLSNSPDKINAEITINKTKNFQIESIDRIRLYYRKQGSASWSIINVNKNKYSAIRDTAVGIRSYSFKVKEALIKRGVIGGYFEFKVAIQNSGFDDLYSETKTLFFELLQVETSPKQTQTFPKAEILDASSPASLRYEIAIKFSEVFLIQKNSRLDGVQNLYYDNFSRFFLDPESVPGLDENHHAILGLRTGPDHYSYFPYQLADSKSSNTRGFLYPASVSEILPCILIKQSNFNQDLKNKSVILFWKINDNFFDYTFFLDRIRVETKSLKIKVQHKDSSGVYQDLTAEITLTQEKHYNPKDNKFVLQILFQDVVNSELFGLIDESYNYSDALRLLVVEHHVICSMINSSVSSQYRNQIFKFDKLLMPHEWKYICYDKYIGSAGSEISAGNSLSLSLDSPFLRGIRLPEKGFQYSDELTGLSPVVNAKTLVFDLKIFYKLSSSVKAFYTDSIIEGTINSIKLPEIPDDVFIIPPDLTIDGPNLIKEGIGSEAARGVVRLDQYGKISGIELSHLGEGYSLYNTLQSKREQTVSDEVPIVVIANYTLVKDNLNITNQYLNIQNLLFDKNNLKASLTHGVRLASIAKDIENSTNVSVDQQIKIDEYLRETPLPEPSEANSAISDYDVVSNDIPLKIESLDSTWNIIQSLYPERSETPSEDLTVYNMDLDPGAEKLSDSSLPASAGLVGGSNSISSSSFNPTSPQLNNSGGSYSTFAMNDLKVLPAGTAAVEVHLSSSYLSEGWSQRLKGGATASPALIGYAALPNMSTRTETFNRLAIAINSLRSVRMMTPQLLNIESTNRTETWVKPYLEGNEMPNVAQFSKNGDKTDTTVKNNSFTPTNAEITIKNNVEVFRKLAQFARLDSPTAGAMAYDISERNTSKFKVKKVSNPFFANASFHLGELEIQEGQFLAKEFRQSYKCSSEALPINENGQRVGRCLSRSSDLFDRASPESNAPTMLQTNSSQITTSRIFETDPVDEVAKYLLLSHETKFDAPCELKCLTEEFVVASVINPDFYPDIAHL